MIFWESCEAEKSVFKRVVEIGQRAEFEINGELNNSILSDSDIKLRYIPIVMSDMFKNDYPARSKLRIKERIYDCAPQLSYKTFLKGSYSECVSNYIEGIRHGFEKTHKMGVSAEQIIEFNAILDRVLLRMSQN
jgi:hypothetical protein